MTIKKRLTALAIAVLLAIPVVMPDAVFATKVGQGSLGGNPTSPSGGTTRYNTIELRTDTDETLGDMRVSTMQSTSNMFEFDHGTLIIHGYGSILGPTNAMDSKYLNPGVIGGSVLQHYRKSWLADLYPSTYDGKTNGPNGVMKPDGSGELYESHNKLNPDAIQYIIIDDKATALKETDIGNTQHREHDSYAMSETNYKNGIRKIEPYTFANLKGLLAIDFDASSIEEIGKYAFSNCPNLGGGRVSDERKEIIYTNASHEGQGKRYYRNHDYGCTADADHTGECTLSGPDATRRDKDYKEKPNRIILPHNLVRLDPHAFQNCPKIEEYIISYGNSYYIAAKDDSNYDTWTDGVLYSSGSMNQSIVKDTGYTRLRAAVMSDYQNCPSQYKRFWKGPFGEKEPMPLEWYVKSWNSKEKAGGGPEHHNWTDIEAAKAKAEVINGGHHSDDGKTVTSSDANWDKYVNHDLTYNDNWWNDNYFDTSPNKYGYDRSEHGTSIKIEAKNKFNNYMNSGSGQNFHTLYLYPEGKKGVDCNPATFFIWPGHDPNTYDPTTAKSDVEVIAPFAFSNAKKLTQVDMTPCEDLNTFGQACFLNCTGLTTVIFPEAGYTERGAKHADSAGRKPNYQLVKLADDMFSQCLNLSHIYNLDRDVGETADLGTMEYLMHIPAGTLAEGFTADYFSTIQEFGQNCFHKCLQLTKGGFHSGSYLQGPADNGLPDSLLIIGQSAFHTCKKLSSLKIHINIEIIGDFAFSDCYNLNDLKFEDKTLEGLHPGSAKDRIPDKRNKTVENKSMQFYMSGGEYADKKAGTKTVQFGDKTFEHCKKLSTLQLGSNWIIRPTTFEDDIYLTLINMDSAAGGSYKIFKYQFDNGNSGQDTNQPDRVSKIETATEDCFESCAYRKGLEISGNAWVKKG